MKGDFLGFSFDGIHCSQLGITHVSSSDRYDEDLFPEVKDKTIEIPNNHGEYYYGSTYGTHTFEINIAYDSITEKQFRDIRRLFGTRKVCELIFDERPYKVYYAKIESPIEMSYVCFDEQKKTEDNSRDGIRRDREQDQEQIVSTPITEEVGVPANGTATFTLSYVPNGEVTLSSEIQYEYDDSTYTYTFTNEGEEPVTIQISYTYNETKHITAWEQITPWKYEYDEGGRPIMQRIYKGEGTVNLICYQPFAHQLFKIKELYEEVGSGKGNLFTKYTNVDEWIDSSGILTRQEYDLDYHIDKTVRIPGVTTTANEGVSVPGKEDEAEAQTITYTLSYIPISEVQITERDGKEGLTYTVEGNTYTFINSSTEDLTVIINYEYIDYDSVPYTYAIPVYNPGDLDVGFALYIPFQLVSHEDNEPTQEILPQDGKSDIIINGDTEILILTPIIQKNKFDTGILIDTRTHLIEGVNYSQIATVSDYRTPAWQKTGSLYNEHIKIGEFPYIKRNDYKLDKDTNRPQAIYISCKAVEGIGIYYDYLYF